jgi:WD40-like Beta Propeller Repeat
VRCLGLIVAAPALVCLALPCPAQAAPEHVQIAFVSDGRIWSSRADGGERRLLLAPTRARETLGQPVWSPDGTKLAYVSHIEPRGFEDPEAAQLMLLDATGARPITPLRKNVVDLSPAWSPDGTGVVFARFIAARGGLFRTHIVTRELASGAERILATARLIARFSSVAEPSWSPDGATIAYTHAKLDRRHYFRPDVRTVQAGGGHSRLLIRDAQSPEWSPDGRRLAFASVRDRNGTRCGSDECSYAGELYTAAADGSALTRLTSNEGNDITPAWSPDGTRILFSSDRNLPEGDSYEVYSIGAGGGCLTWLTNGTPSSSLPTWRPASGTRYDPGSCDPGTRPALVDPPPLPEFRGGLWLGPRYRGLLLSGVERTGRNAYLYYRDCELFDPRRCQETVDLAIEPACRPFAFRGITSNAYRFLRREGAIVAFAGREAGVRLMSGHAVTTIHLAEGSSLPAVYRLMQDLRPFDAARPGGRLAPPRVPRRVARRLDSAARGQGRHVRRSRQLRRALRSFGPYRLSSCDR